MKHKTFFIVTILLSFAVPGLAQQAPDAAQPQTVEQKLARVFQEWERPDRPGGVVAVVEKGQVIFKRSFGLANVEYQLPSKPQTVYDVGELAEAVTGMAVAMLEDQGKIAAADPVKKYLPDLPSCADGLTIAHLVHHTSGLPDWYDLLTVAGWNDGDVITTEHIHKIFKRQKQLLFEPGSRSLPSRTDYVLLAQVVSRVTGESLRDWSWTNIFKPLGMTRTLFRDSYKETIENRAYSINYDYREGELKGADNLGAVGSLGLFTTLDDFIKWVQNLENPVVGSARVKDMMTTAAKLSDGRETGHSYGLSVDTYKGLKRVYKSGSWGGFRTAFRYFPTASFAVFVFTNWDYNWNDPNQVADGAAEVCLEPLLKKPAAPPVPAAEAAKKKPAKLSPAELAQYAGEYRSAAWGYLTVAQEKDALVFKLGGQSYPLIAAGEGRFAFKDPNIPIVLTFSRGADGKASQFSFDSGNGEITAGRVERETLSGGQLELYRGTYYCEDLDARYEIVAGEGRLVLSGLRTTDIVLTPENRKTFVSGNAVFRMVSFLIGENGEVTGFRVDSDSLPHLIFKKS